MITPLAPLPAPTPSAALAEPQAPVAPDAQLDSQSAAPASDKRKHQLGKGEIAAHAAEGLLVADKDIIVATANTRAAGTLPDRFETSASNVHLAPSALTFGANAGAEITRSSALAAIPLDANADASIHSGIGSGLVINTFGGHVGAGDNTTLSGLHGFEGKTSAFGLTATTKIGDATGSLGVVVVGAGETTLTAEKYEKIGDRVLMAYTEVAAGSAQVTAGIHVGFGGAGGRFGVSGARRIEQRFWMPRIQAAELLKEATFGQRLKRTVRLRGSFAKPFNLKDPLNEAVDAKKHASFNIGESVSITKTGSLVGGVALTGAGVYAGLHGTWSGTYVLKVTKETETDVLVEIIPRIETRAAAVSLDIPLASEVRTQWAQARATRHSLRFDLSKSAAHTAYMAVLQGKLPSLRTNNPNYQALDTTEARFVVVQAQADMPSGLTYISLEQSAVPRKTTFSVAATFTQFVPYVGWPGFAVTKSKKTAQAVIASSDGAVRQDEFSRTDERQMPHKGTWERSGWGLLTDKLGSNEASPSLQDLQLGVTLSSDRTRRDLRNDSVARLNASLFQDKPLNLFGGPQEISKYKYEITAQLSVSPKKLADMAPDGRSVIEQAKYLRGEVAKGGLVSLMSMLESLHATPQDIVFSVRSEAPEIITKKAFQVSVRYADRINPKKQTPADIVARFKKVEKYIDLIQRTYSDVQSDPLLARLDLASKSEQLLELGKAFDVLLRRIDYTTIPRSQLEELRTGAAYSAIRDTFLKWETATPKLNALPQVAEATFLNKMITQVAKVSRKMKPSKSGASAKAAIVAPGKQKRPIAIDKKKGHSGK